MAITKFQFVDNLRGWTLNEVSFSKFNLFVGVSGVGKTRILRALQSVRRAGISDACRTNGCSWTLELESEGMKFLWMAETSLVVREPLSQLSDINEDDERQSAETPRFIRERIVRDDKVVIVDRTEDDFLFDEKVLPKLKNTESAITLLRDENVIAPINRALHRFLFSEDLSPSSNMPYNLHQLSKIRMRYRDLDALREATDVPALVKAYILQEDHPDEFQQIKDNYSEIFGTVYNVRLGKLRELASLSTENAPPSTIDWIVISVKEDRVNGWIIQPQLSSGMFRVLVHLIELAMAPRGTVIVIDEIENSLGVNCLPELTDRFLERSRELQFILTSHHPYIINNVPSKWWKIVTRKGSTVTVLDEESIPALKTTSSHEKFILLMNLKEYEEGIQ